MKTAAEDSTTPQEDSSVTKESPGIEQQTRVLEGAAPKESAVGRSTEVVAMVRRADSKGLREYLDHEALSTVTSEDVLEKPFELEFAVDAQGKVQAAEVCLRLDSPDFEPPSQTKKLRVPPQGNSPLCTFLIRPTMAGELIANLELLKGEETVVSRRIKTRVVAEGSPVGPGVNIVSIPITILVQDSSGDLFRFVGAAQSSPTKPSPPLSPECPPRKAVGEFTEMFGAPRPPEGSPSKPAAYTQILSVSGPKSQHLSPDTKALAPAADAGQRAMPIGGDTHVGRRTPATSSYSSRWKKLMLTAGAIVFSVIAVLFGVQYRGLRTPTLKPPDPRREQTDRAASRELRLAELGLPPEFFPDLNPNAPNAQTTGKTWRSSRSTSAQQCGVDPLREPKRIFAASDKKSWREYKPSDAIGLWRRADYAVLWNGRDGNLLIRVAEPGKDFAASTEYCFNKAGQLVQLSFVLWTDSGWGYHQEGPIVNGAIVTESSEFFSTGPVTTGAPISKPEQVNDLAGFLKPRLYLTKSQLPFSKMLPR